MKLLKHAFKLCKKILDGRSRDGVGIYQMQYRFMPGKGTVDAALTWKRFLIGCQGKLYVLLLSGRVFLNIW